MESGVSISTGVSEQARERLREAVVSFGRAAFAEPRRSEAILRDLCPNAPREVFLLVSALHENVAAELVSNAGVPDDALTAKLTHRLSESLGLSEDAARWAVDAWRYALEDNPGLSGKGEGLRSLSGIQPAVEDEDRPAAEYGPSVDWPWLGMCFVAVVAVAIALVSGTWLTFFHQWQAWPGGILEIAAMALALACAGFVQTLASRSFGQMAAPDHRALDPRKVPYALLPEVVVLLLMPLVPVALPVMWAMEWWGSLHAVGLPHSAAFHTVRSFESLVLAAFLYCWIPTMVEIQGRLASSLVRRR